MSWCVLGTFVTLFYQSTLRASLMGQEYEKPVLYHEDVVSRGKTVYMVDLGYTVIFGYRELICLKIHNVL